MKEAHFAKGHGQFQAYCFFFPDKRYRPAVFKVDDVFYFKGKFSQFHRDYRVSGLMVDEEKNRLAIIGAHRRFNVRIR